MKISLDWLKQYVDVDLPLPELVDRLTMIGLVAEEWEEKGGDVVLDLETYANRPDTLGHLGIAREVAAMLGVPLKEQAWPLEELPVLTSELVEVQILDENLCPRYCGLVVRGVTIGPSPEWLRTKIEAMGLKSINNVVDVTNYVLFATAQPIHAFDLAKLAGPRIIVRRAKKGEAIRTLEGKEAALTPEMLVIADEKRPVAVAGVIGGEESAVSGTTRDVFIESAYFDPISVRRTRKALEIQTDAGYRFERGADISFAPTAAVMAASLIHHFGGKAAKETIDVYPRPRKNKEIILRGRRVVEILGVEVAHDFVEKTLLALGFALSSTQAGIWRVLVPFHRIDIEREADLIEEIARFFGYDKIPVVVPPLEVLEPVPSAEEKIRKLSRRLFHYGFDEAVNQSFADPEKETVFGNGLKPIEIRNPISSKAGILRTTLLGGLLENTEWNKNRGTEGVHLFEVGKIYHWSDLSTTDRLASERLFLGVASTGPLGEPHWQTKPSRANIFHLKGALEAVMEALRYTPHSFEPDSHPYFEEGSCLALAYKGEKVGRLGAVSRRLLELHSLKDPAFAAELDLDLLFGKQPRPFEYVPLPKFPAVSRDLSFVVDRRVSYQEIKQAIDKLALPHLEDFTVLDCYVGEPVPPPKKSVLIRFVFRNPKATLLAEDADRAERKIIKSLTAAFEIELREGGEVP